MTDPRAFRFPSTYVGSFMSMETNIITSKTQRNAENARVNGMWQLGFSKRPFTCLSFFPWFWHKIFKKTVLVSAGWDF